MVKSCPNDIFKLWKTWNCHYYNIDANTLKNINLPNTFPDRDIDTNTEDFKNQFKGNFIFVIIILLFISN